MKNFDLAILSCNYNALHNLKPALESWAVAAEFMQKSKVGPVRLYLTDNNSKDGSKEFLTEFSKKPDTRFTSCQIFLNEINSGKSKAVNEMSKIALQSANSTLLFLLDSDISICHPEMLAIASEIAELTSDKVSSLVCWQTGNSLFARKFSWTNSIKANIPPFSYFVPKEGFGVGIAGGAMFMWDKNWKNIGGFRENMGNNGKSAIYGAADGCLLFDSFSITNKPIMVIKELEVYHPPEIDIKYQEWKKQLHKEHIINGHAITERGFFD